MAQKVKFKRHTTAEIEELEIEDGALVYNIDNGKTYMDYGTERIQTGGNADTMISIGDEEPTDEDIKIWINTPTSETKASEIVNEYTDSDKVGYSTQYMNNALESIVDIYSTDEIKTNKVWIDGKPIYRKTFTGTVSSAINHGLTNVNFVNAYGFYVSSSGTFLPIPSLRPNNSQFNIGFYVSSTQITFDKGSSASGDCYITLEYTKTTDQGGV